MKATLTPEGSITLTPRLLEELGLSAGQEILIETTSEGILLKPQSFNVFAAWVDAIPPLVDDPIEQLQLDKAAEHEILEPSGDLPMIVHSMKELEAAWQEKKKQALL